jgi:hypothetical protein
MVEPDWQGGTEQLQREIVRLRTLLADYVSREDREHGFELAYQAGIERDFDSIETPSEWAESRRLLKLDGGILNGEA